MAFTEKFISISFSYANGVFAGGGNSYTAKGLRTSVRIVTPGGEDKGNLEAEIYGMTLSEMNRLTILPTQVTAVGVNTVTVMAGDDPNALSTVFVGTITIAYCDASAQPEVCFRVSAVAGLVEEIKPAQAASPQGVVDVAQQMQSFAQQMGVQFENNNVSIKLRFRYYWGSVFQQVRALAREAGIEYVLENGILAIWNPGQARQGAATIVSPATGMVGYPAFTASGIIVTTLFQGTLKFGGRITVQSQLQPACGDWTIYYISYALDAQTPKGRWFATINASLIGVRDDG